MKRFQQTKHALGSDALLTIVLQDDLEVEPIFIVLWDLVAAFERKFSRFLPDSELSQINHSAGRDVHVTPAFRRLLTTTLALAEQTDGLYNPLILPALQRAGYKGSWPHPEKVTAQTNYESRQIADWRDIEIEDKTVRLPADSALDFGGIGKGYLLDQLADCLTEQDITNYWLSLGGDIICAGFDEPGDTWKIGIQHALGSEVVTYISNRGRRLAIATSGVTKRKGFTEHGSWHHIIDPRSGKPAETDILTATVCSDSATEADVIAKTLVIAGSSRAHAIMKSSGLDNAMLQLGAADQEVTIQTMGTIWSV